MVNESNIFEKFMINQLQEARILVQKKTFTKWMNSYLQKAKMEVNDIFVDLADGRKLLKLLEIISGDKLSKPNSGKMRVHKIENVNKCLAFLHTKVKLESIGAEDIVDGNKTLILGLLWTIILRFQIQDIEIQMEEEGDKKHSSKEALLLWCQRKTHGYPHVNVIDFTQSWRSGMAFNALIHSHRNDLVDYNSLNPNNHIENLNNAFRIAQQHLAVQPLLDAEDVDTPKVDERSILTYVSSFYHTFAKYNSEIISGKRITNIISQLMEIDRLQLNYEMFTTNLLNWIQMKIFELDNRDFPNSLEEIHNEFLKFKQYRTIEKPPKYKERSEIEAHLFNVQTKRKALGQTLYVPPEGKLVQDIQKCWVDLEKAEHRRELVLREEMIRLEKLENLSESFFRKSEIRKGYLNEKIRVLSNARHGLNLAQIEATVKKDEGIFADILSRSERIEALSHMVKELEEGNYHNIKLVKNVEKEIKTLWEKLIFLLDQHRSNLSITSNFVKSQREIETVGNELTELINRINIDTNVSHLRAVEEYLQNHSLMEAQISSHGETVRKINNTASNLMNDDKLTQSNLIQKEIVPFKNSIDSLNSKFSQLNEIAKVKRQKLSKLRDFYQLLQDIDEDDASLSEKINICQAILPGKDLLGIISLQQKHNALEAEVNAYQSRLDKLLDNCKTFIEEEHPKNRLVQNKLESLMQKWEQLQSMTKQKSKELSDAIEAFQYHADANETESWLKEKMPLVKSEDYGNDEQSALSLLQRHSRLESEVIAYEHDIERLNSQSERMVKSGVENLFLLCDDPFMVPTSLINETPVEDVTEEVIVTKEVMQDVYEEVTIPQVLVLYKYKGKDYSVKKGEILILLNKTTLEWWNVKREHENYTGYVPSNYVKEIEPKRMRILTQKPVQVQEKQLVKRPANKSRFKRNKNPRRLSIVSGTETVEQRKLQINVDYQELVSLCKTRRELLEDSVKMFRFIRECDMLEDWMDNIEQVMIKANDVYNEQKQDSKNDNAIGELSKQFEKFITELLANRARLDQINKMSTDIYAKMYASVIKRRRENIHKKWDNLNFLQKQLGKNIEGLTTVELFNASCDETLERINDKLNKINNDQNVGHDLKTVQALQRRHENTERELVPIEDALKKIAILSDNVISSYPLQKEHVSNRLAQLNSLWENLKKCSMNKKANLDKMIGLRILKNSTSDLTLWITNYVKPLLQIDKQNASLKNSDNLDSIIKEHSDLLVDIQGKANDIADIKDLSDKLSNQIPKEDIDAVESLITEYDNVHKEWHKKSDYLKQCSDLISFNHAADHIDTIITSDLAYLDLDKLGNNIYDVISLQKQHDNFMNTLLAQDQKIHNFVDLGEKMIQNNHFDSPNIDSRRKKIVERRKELKDKAFNRNKQLIEAKTYQDIKSFAEEFLNWCAAKQKSNDENDFKNLSNMERKLKKHQAFAAEVRANKSQLDKILNNIGYISKDLAANELSEIEKQLNEQWNKLIQSIEVKDKMFNQAFIQIDFSKTVRLTDEKVNEISKVAFSNDYGNDRRSCKKLLQRNKFALNELALIESKLNDLENNGKDIAENHLNSNAILESCDNLKKNIADLKTPLEERKRKLLESYQFYEFEFDVHTESQWIKEHVTLATLGEVPQNLTDAHNLIKKFEQNLNREVQGHENCIKKVVLKGHDLVTQNHFSSDVIKAKVSDLEEQWENLLNIMQKRHQTLKTSLEVQQFLSECNEIEAWLDETINLLNSGIYGNDETTVVKLLQKQKSIDLEIDAHAIKISDLNRQMPQLIELVENENDEKLFTNRVSDLNNQLKKLKKLNNERSLALMELKKQQEFFRESNEFLAWISAQKQTLLNEDYGKDFEHCTDLQSKFFDLKRTILSNEEHFNQSIEFANSLAKSNGGELKFSNKTVLEKAWNELLDVLHQKECKFVAAIKIHRFNRDVFDAYDRIMEKKAILNNEDFGRDTHSVQNLIRKHDIFENDLVALEAQLQVLINDSVALTEAYPGGNAKSIAEKLNNVVQHWELLKNESAMRRQRLVDSESFHCFVSIVRDLEQWALNLIAQFKTLENVKDVQSSQKIRMNHDRLEIEIRDKKFDNVVHKANGFLSKQCYPEVKSLTEKLLETRELLQTSCQTKTVYLDQLVDLNFFLKDVKQLEQLYQQHLNRLNSYDSGNTVEEVDASLKRHEQFTKIFESHQHKFDAIKECGEKLIEKNHFNSELIGSKISELFTKRNQLKAVILQRKDELSDAFILAQFKRDVFETELWIEEKQNQLQKEHDSIQDDDNVEFKLKKLQKHQTFEAEINANSSRFTDIQNKAKHLIEKKHPSSVEIRNQQDQLLTKWDQLVTLLKKISLGFEEAKDIYEFNRNIGEIESWIREKEMMIQFNDTGEDYEHCSFLLRKLDDVDTGMKVDENRILQINHLANKLVSQCKREFFNEEQLVKQQNTLNDNWQQLQQKIVDYRNKLLCSLEIHSLNRDLDDLLQRISEKQHLVAKEFDPKNLKSAEGLHRKHEAIMLEIYAIESQFKKINDNEARKLISKYPELTEKSRAKIHNIQETLRKLDSDCKARERKLIFSVSLHKFFEMVKEIENWVNDMIANKLSNVSTSVNVAEAKIELQTHEYVRAEINARRDNYQAVKNFAIALLQQIEHNSILQTEQSPQIEASMQKVDELRKKLDQAWEEKNLYLKQCLELRMFNDLSKKCDSWLASKEAFLTNEDLGSNLSSAQELLKKHETFVKSLATQQRVTDFITFAEELIKKKHFDFESINNKYNETLKRRENLFELCKVRKNKLDDSKCYFNFLRNVNEIQGWLNEKIKVAADESYRDQINLLSKIQKHAAFEAEIIANKKRIDAVILEGEKLINQQHFKSDDIKSHLANIEKLNRSLNESANLKQIRLNDAYQALQFFRLCDDIELWIKDIESVLKDEDRGKDLTSVRNLLNNHQLIENDVHNHNEMIEQVKDYQTNFTQNNHFLKDEVEERAMQIVQCFHSIHAPMNKRRENLEEMLSFYQFKRDVEDEFLWLDDKDGQMSQFDNATTLQDIQRLIKKHKMFELELQTREPQLSSLISKGHNLSKSSNNNCEDLKQLTYRLQSRIQKLKDESFLRRLRLADSLESFQLYSDVAEAESWINEKKPFLLNEDNGKDEESVLTISKKLEVLEKDTDRFYSTTITKLTQQSEQFKEKNHCDSQIIQEKMNTLTDNFNSFVKLIEKKKVVLQKTNKYFLFEREADELIAWIKDQLILANSEDYGLDVEHNEKLIQQFDNFISNINSNEERVVSLQTKSTNVENSHAKMAQISSLWDGLKEATQAKHDFLQAARKVHTFNRSAEETICWIREKESSSVLDEVDLNYVDLSTIQAKIRELEGFDRDLEAVREQVEALFVEAEKMECMFTDVKQSIEERKNNVQTVWHGLLQKTLSHKENLIQIEKIQSYLDDYQDLLTWINEMQALITADDKLESDVISAEEQLSRHHEYKLEIDTRNDSIASFLANGEKNIAQGNFMSNDIKERNSRIKNLHTNLLNTWNDRLTLYEYNLDARQFVQDSEQVQKWIDAHISFIDDNNYGDSLAEVEDLIGKHEEFEKTIQAQMDKLKAIERITMMEKYFEELKAKEEASRIEQANLREKERMQQLFQEEQRKILSQRKNEDESRHYENAPFSSRDKQLKSTPSLQHKDKSKTPRRIASFSFSRKSNKVKPLKEDLPPIACEGYLERKQVLQKGKKASSRSWKSYYTVLCGQIMCFFKDDNGFYENIAAASPFSIQDARCMKVLDYTKKKYVFSIQLRDMTKYLFSVNDETKLSEWIKSISFRASLPPSLQLVGNDERTNHFIEPINEMAERKRSESVSSSSSQKSSLSSPSLLNHSRSNLVHPERSPHEITGQHQQYPSRSSSSQEHQYSNLPATNGAQYSPQSINGTSATNSTNNLGITQASNPYSSTYQNIPVTKYMSLPANISPAPDQANFVDRSSTNSVKSSESDAISLNEKKKNKRRSFFKRLK